MFIYEGIGGVVLFLAMSVLAIYFYGRLCRDAGYEEGRGDRHEEQLAENRAARAGRHRMSQPRVSPSPPPAALTSPASGPAPAAPPPPRDPATWYEVFHDTPSAAAAAPAIDTILLAPQPAPALDGAEDTGTMPRVQLDLASTGELRAITSAWIAENCPGAEEAEAIA
jgi:Na+-transporting methylmalonyl-CoA/oxaloacetate decarboxylase gamma subunit